MSSMIPKTGAYQKQLFSDHRYNSSRTRLLPQYHSYIKTVLRLSIALPIAFGILALVGWWTDVSVLKSIFPGFTQMNPMSAMVLIFSSVALLLQYRDLSMFFSLGVITISLIKAMSFSGVDLEIDQLLFSSVLGENRMSPQATFAFFVIGIGLLSLRSDTRNAKWTTEIAGSIAIGVSFMAILGYIYDVRILYGISEFIPIALNTAVAVLFLSIGLIASRPDTGLAQLLGRIDGGGSMLRRTFPFIVLAPLLFGWIAIRALRTESISGEFAVVFLVTGCILVLLLSNLKGASHLSESDQALRKQSNTLRLILDSMGEGVVVTDKNGMFTLFNPAASRLTGVGISNLPPSQWTAHYGVFHSDRKTRFKVDEFPLTLAIKGIETDGVVQYLLNEMVPEGIFIEVAGRPLRDESGEVIGGVVVFRDVTQQRALRKLLEDSHAKLKEMNFEQTVKLKQTEAQVQNLQKVDAVGRLAASMLLELKSELETISGRCDVLLGARDAAPVVKENAEAIKVATSRISADVGAYIGKVKETLG